MTNGLLPILFATEHLKCKFLKYNATELCQLQEARKSYDLEYPSANGKGPHHTHQRRQNHVSKVSAARQNRIINNMASSSAVAPEENDLSTLASLRMNPHLSPIIDDADRIATLPDNDDESASDDGSDVIKGDTYLPIDGSIKKQ